MSSEGEVPETQLKADMDMDMMETDAQPMQQETY
jgi:hypothetical protein